MYPCRSRQHVTNGQQDGNGSSVRHGKQKSAPARVIENKPQNTIWLIGGSGDVGAKTARLLSSNPALSIVVAGRNRARASASIRDLGKNVRAVVLDVTAPGAAEAIDAGATIVNFVEATPHSLAEAVIAGGGRFIETSASPDLVAVLEERFRGTALPGLAIVNTGLAPGMTNILATELKSRAPDTRSLDIVIELGMGRHHGAAGTFWTLNNIASDYPVRLNDIEQRVPPGALQRRIRFRGDTGHRLAIGFGFSDQIAVARSLDLETARTFLAFEPAWMTHLLHLVINLGFGRSAARHARLLTRLLAWGPTYGKAGTRVVVQGCDAKGGRTARIEIHSGNQAAMTAALVAEAVRAAQAAGLNGVAQSAQLISFETAVAAVKSAVPETRTFVCPAASATPQKTTR